MKINTKIPKKKRIIEFAKNFSGTSPLHRWVRFLWFFFKYFIFSFLLMSGCLGLLAFLVLGLIPDSVVTELSYLNLGDAAVLIQTTIYKVFLPSSVIYSVIITLERYKKALNT